jgi:hypothetical protein
LAIIPITPSPYHSINQPQNHKATLMNTALASNPNPNSNPNSKSAGTRWLQGIFWAFLLLGAVLATLSALAALAAGFSAADGMSVQVDGEPVPVGAAVAVITFAALWVAAFVTCCALGFAAVVTIGTLAGVALVLALPFLLVLGCGWAVVALVRRAAR